MTQILEILKDLPGFLDGFVHEHGVWVHALLFAIVFAETGLVIMPFLPGDSLLFAVGAVAARESEPISVWVAAVVLIVAAVLGDAVNYAIGRRIGPRVFIRQDEPGLLGKMLNRKHLMAAQAFFERHGGKAIVLGRFVPIVRTFVPFVAGVGSMSYPRFAFYNVSGAILWVGLCVGAGYAFGNVPFVQKHFEAVMVGIIVVSVLPIVVETIRSKRAAARAKR